MAVAAVLIGAPASSAQADQVVAIVVSPDAPMSGEKFVVSGTIGTAVVRPVVLQRLKGTIWKKVASGTTDAAGAFGLTGRAWPKAATIRVWAKTYVIGTTVYPDVYSGTAVVTPAAQSGRPVVAPALYTYQTSTATLAASPARPGRVVRLQIIRKHRWRTLASGVEGVDGTATVSFTPTIVGTRSVRLVAKAYRGAAAYASKKLNVTALAGVATNPTAALAITTTSLPDGVNTEAYTAPLAATGGTAPYVWAANRLPAGLSVNQTTGVIGGTPSASGSWWADVFVTDHFGKTTAALVRINVVATPLTKLSAGGDHTCAVTRTGAVTCWGANGSGQLGNNHTAGSVSGLSAGVSAVSAGGSHSCALTSGGVAWCWGANGSGQLGDFSNADRAVPVQVYGLSSGVSSLTAGAAYSCAIKSGSAKCWGAGESGQLGNNTTAGSNTPVQVSGLTSDVTSLAAGFTSTCAIKSGSAKCWGLNASGQLGNKTTANSLVPVQVSGLTKNVSAIAVGRNFACALVSGAVKCWGANDRGQLGNNSGVASNVPVQVAGLTAGVSAISAGEFQACALVSGATKCWGANDRGQLGNGGTVDSHVPVQVSGLATDQTAVSSGDSYGCGLTKSGTANCWGRNDSGQLGDGSTTDRYAPVKVTAFD